MNSLNVVIMYYRWLHAKCDGMNTEDDCEKAADFGYHCINCRPEDEPPPHIQGN